MSREAFQSNLMQQMMMDESSPKWWSINNSSRPPPPAHGFSDHLLRRPPSSSSSTVSTPAFPQYLSQPSSIIVPATSLPGHKDLPADSWSQLLLGGVVGEEEKYELSLLQPKRTDNWEEEQQAMNTPLVSAPTAADRASGYFQVHGGEEEEEEEGGGGGGGGGAEGILSWRQILPAAAAATSLCSSMLDFSSNMADNYKRHHPDTECNSTSTGEAHKKARVQVSSAQCAFKVRKEKLGDRITALHQLVSPFGKTDTASVLLEAIGYIRFLQSQIEALSTPYLGCRSGNNRQPAFLHESGTKKRRPQDDHEEEEKKQNKDEQAKKRDLRSRGLCLVPVAFTLHVGSDTSAADFWAPAFTSGDGGGGGGCLIPMI